MTIEEMKTKIFELVGTASMCWNETPHGVFDSTQATKVAEQILSIYKSEIAEACKKQREICRREYFTTITRLIQPIIHQGLENAPSPLDEVK